MEPLEISVRTALKRQHHAALQMLRLAVERCPESVWIGGEHPRNYWRIVYHAAAYAHLYLYENLDRWVRWEPARKECAWLDGDDVPVMEPYTQAQMLDYVDLIRTQVDSRIDALDLSDPNCGYTWYPEVSRVELLVLSLRHLHGHIGQLSERLIEQELDVDWLGQPLA
jgi:hypothetical protein